MKPVALVDIFGNGYSLTVNKCDVFLIIIVMYFDRDSRVVAAVNIWSISDRCTGWPKK